MVRCQERNCITISGSGREVCEGGAGHVGEQRDSGEE